jgi:outer membrane protein TolC
MIAEQIEIKKAQAELQELNAKLATYRAEELKALAFIAQITNPQQPPTQPHTVTQEDLDANPELVEAGVQVGDEVLIPVQEEVMEQPKRKLKKDPA